MSRAHKKQHRGILAIETAVGVSIAVLILLFATHTLARFINTGKDLAEKTQALYLAEEGLEMVRFMRDQKWEHISNLTDGDTYYLNITPSSIATTTSKEVIEGFTRSFEIQPVERQSGTDDIVLSGTPDSGSKYVTVRVSWGTPTSTVSLTGILADINNP